MTRVRTFLAVEVSDSVRERIVALQEKLTTTLPEVRWEPPENLHLTLLFLGSLTDRELVPVCQEVQQAVRSLPAFAMTVEGVGCFPNSRRPRTLWAGITTGRDELHALHAALEAPLVASGYYRREERAYTPHVTLGRIKTEPAEGTVADLLQPHHTWKAGISVVTEVRLMSSVATSSGPAYAVLTRARLK